MNPVRISPLVFFLLAAGLAAYLSIAHTQFIVNDNLTKSDQLANINFTKESFHSRLQYTGQRNRMPLFPWIQSLFYSPGMSDEQLFEQGKRLNVIISLISVVIFAIIFGLKFSKLYSAFALTVIALLLFALKAPFFQADILYFSLIALAFILAIETIRGPRWYKSLAVGLLFALAHFTKASGLLGLALYTCSFSIPIAQRLMNRSLNRRELFRLLAHAIGPVIVFSVLLFPYFNESKERYGQYLYNVNTTFYMWYDSWDEVESGTGGAGDSVGWPDLPDNEIPSLEKYLAEHSVEDIMNRLGNGLSDFVAKTCIREYDYYKYGNCPHIAAGLVVLIGSLSLGMSRISNSLSPAKIQAGFFISAFLLLYALSSFWYWEMSSGPRITQPLFIPLFWTIGLVGESALTKWPDIKLRGYHIKPLDLLYGLMLVLAFYQVYELVFARAALLYGGK